MSLKFGAAAPVKSYGGLKLPKKNRGDPNQKIKFIEFSKKINFFKFKSILTIQRKILSLVLLHKNVPINSYKGSKLLIKGLAARGAGLRLDTKNVSFSVNNHITMY